MLLVQLATATGAGAQSPLQGLDLFMPPGPAERDGPAAVALGRLLFFDPRLSRDSTISCASCHRPERGFADPNPQSVGVAGRRGARNVPAIVNRGWGRAFFWDGRMQDLEAQVLEPITAPQEMDLSVEEALVRIREDPGYPERFRGLFGGAPTQERLGIALAAYVRSIRAAESRFDQAMGGDRGALTPLEQVGLDLFQRKARCVRCHSGPLLTDEGFHNTGVAWRNGDPSDPGRARVTGRTKDLGAFKTPTLRQLPSTAPYMHDGSLRTLEEVVDFYDRGGHPNPGIDPLIQPLDLSSEEKRALVALLGALQGRIEEGVR